MNSTATLMMSPQKLREFQADCETVRANLSTGKLHLQALRDKKRADGTLRRTRLAALDLGKALQRMHETESYRDSHDSWASLCRALKVHREESYEFMNAAKVVASAAPEDIQAIPGGLTRKNVKDLVKIEPEERSEVLHQAASNGGNVSAAIIKFRQSLEAGADVPLNEGEAPKQPKADHDVAWIRRQVTSMTKWFEERGMTAAEPHLAALLAIAEERPHDLD